MLYYDNTYIAKSEAALILASQFFFVFSDTKNFYFINICFIENSISGRFCAELFLLKNLFLRLSVPLGILPDVESLSTLIC